jgi:hypothetical protein
VGEAVANAEDLYGLPLTEFTAARDALAKERRAAGDKEAAEGVKSLQKPSLTAWALDQAARAHPEAVARLLERGAGLREAQQEALTGDASRLREAGREVVEEVDRVATQAAEALRAAGREPGAAQLERIRATLRAAAADPGVGELLRRGVLVVDAEPAGFGLGGLEAAPAPTARRRPGRPPGEAGQAVEAARRELRRAQAEADAAAGRAHRRVERAEAAERRAQEARNEADAARVEAEEAAGEADAARRRAEEAARRLSEAEE